MEPRGRLISRGPTTFLYSLYEAEHDGYQPYCTFITLSFQIFSVTDNCQIAQFLLDFQENMRDLIALMYHV